jgi:uncharacterized glyoxalase superfamily protein PhnB
MVENRSAPPGPVVPHRCYRDTNLAAEWLCRAFGFREVLRWGSRDEPSVQLAVGDGAIFLRPPRARDGVSERTMRLPLPGEGSHSMLVPVPDVDAHHEQAMSRGARLQRELQTYRLIGERQYTVLDLDGHVWTFSQSVADVDPRDWAEVCNPIS